MHDPQLVRKLNRVLPLQHRRPIPYQPAPDSTLNRAYLAEIAALSYEDYMTLVGRHLGLEHAPLWDYFLHPTLRHRTLSVLMRKHALVVRRLYEPRDRRTERALRGYLDLCSDRIEQTLTAIGNSAFETQRKTIRMLVNAIVQHRQATQDNDVEPERWDQHLWHVLDLIDLPDPPTESPKAGPIVPEPDTTRP